MANEIWHNYPEANNLDVYVFNKTNDNVFDNADGGDTWEVWADGNVLNYDIPMTDHGGDYYSVDFPAAITTAGVYRIAIALRAGANAAVGDTRIAQGEIHWDGTAEIDTTAFRAYILSDVIGADGDTLETLSDQMDGLSSEDAKVLNVYGEDE
jgi:hypothetical protein